MSIARWRLLVVVGLVLASFAGITQGVLVSKDDGSGAVVIFNSGGYESGENALDPPAHATVGSWKHARDGGYAGDGGLMIVESSASKPVPGPYLGRYYQHNLRGTAGEDAFSRAQFDGGAVSSGTLRADWMMYVADPNNSVNAIAFWSDSGGNPLGGIRADASGGGNLRVLGFDNNGAITGWDNTSVPIAFGKWQHYSMEWTLGLPVMTVAVDGVSADVGAPAFPNAVTWVQFSPASAGAEFFLDDMVSIPEPASLVLLALGCVLAIRRR